MTLRQRRTEVREGVTRSEVEVCRGAERAAVLALVKGSLARLAGLPPWYAYGLGRLAGVGREPMLRPQHGPRSHRNRCVNPRSFATGQGWESSGA